MVKIFVRRIKAGLMTIDEVGNLWRKQVREILEAEGYFKTEEEKSIPSPIDETSETVEEN
jgi:exonuclease VII large subunit